MTISLPIIHCYMRLKKSTDNNINISVDRVVASISLKKRVFNKMSQYIAGYIRYFIFQVGLIPSHTLRNLIYRHVLLIDLHPRAVIYFRAEIRAPYKLKIGHSIIGDNALLDARNGLTIGNNVNLSNNVSIYTEQHDHRCPMFKCNSDDSFGVQIDDRAWLGPNTIILPGARIGEGAVVAAGAVVTKSVEPFSIVAGCPAKKVGERNRELNYTFNGDHIPFY